VCVCICIDATAVEAIVAPGEMLYIPRCVCVYIYMYTYLYIYSISQVCVCVYVPVCLCVCVHTHTHTYTHTHTHTLKAILAPGEMLYIPRCVYVYMLYTHTHTHTHAHTHTHNTHTHTPHQAMCKNCSSSKATSTVFLKELAMEKPRQLTSKTARYPVCFLYCVCDVYLV